MAHLEQREILREKVQAAPKVMSLPIESQGTREEAVLHLEILGERLIASLRDNPHVAFAYAIGSTAEGKENEYSDKDVGVVVKTDDDLNFMLNNAGKAYSTFGDLVGYYKYSPYHFYVTYHGAIGPMPLDIYYLTEEMHELMRSSQLATVVNHIVDTKTSEIQSPIVEKMLLDTHIVLERARSYQEKGDCIEVVKTLDGMRERLLIHLLRVVEKYNIPHIKAVNLVEFDPEIRELFIRTFAQPNTEMTQDAINATQELLDRLLEDASDRFDLESVKKIVSGISEGYLQHMHPTTEIKPPTDSGYAHENSLVEGTIQILDKITDVGLATLQSSETGEQKLVVMMRDDESLNKLIRTEGSFIRNRFPDSQIQQLTPVHLRVLNQKGEVLDVFLTSSSLYFTSRKTDTLVLVDNRKSKIDNLENVFDTASDFPELSGERELIVKGIVRTYRLLSKINKNDFVTLTYIMSSIRSGQLIPLLKCAGFNLNKDTVFPMTYGQPTAEGARNSVLASMVLFAEAYIRIRDTHNLRDLDVYVQKAYDAVKEFTQQNYE